MNLDTNVADVGVRGLSDHIVADCGLDSLSIFICDRTQDRPELHYLYHVGVSEETKHVYRDCKVFELDPFSDTLLRERPDLINSESLMLAKDARLCERGTRRADYWRFLADHNVTVVGASAKRFMEGLYLVIGTHTRAGRHHPAAVPVALLDHEIRGLMRMVSDRILDSMLHQRAGYITFRNSLAVEADEKPSALKALSRREMEIAALIGAGKQNKEVAYLTGLSPYTIENHLRRIYRKLGLHNRAALASIVAQSTAWRRIDGNPLLSGVDDLSSI